MGDDESPLMFAVPRYVMAALYFAVGVVSVVQLARILVAWRQDPQRFTSHNRVILCAFAALGVFTRGAHFVLQCYMRDGVQVNHAVDMLLYIAPTYSFVTVYTMLFLATVLVYQSLYHMPMVPLYWISLVVNGLLYATATVLFFTNLYVNPCTDEQIGAVCTGEDYAMQALEIGAFVVIAVCFSVYSAKIFRKLGWIANYSALARHQRRLFVVTIYCTIALALRCALIAASLSSAGLSFLQTRTYVLVIDYMLLDFAPVALALFAIGRQPDGDEFVASVQVGEGAHLVSDSHSRSSLQYI